MLAFSSVNSLISGSLKTAHSWLLRCPDDVTFRVTEEYEGYPVQTYKTFE